MKKILVILLLLCAFAQKSTTAQKYKIIAIGAKFGINTTNLSALDNHTYWKSNYTIGGFGEIRPHRNFALCAEMLHSKQSQNPILGSINLPLLLKYSPIANLAIYTGINPQMGTGSSISIPVGIGYSCSWGLTLDVRYNIGADNGILVINPNLGSMGQYYHAPQSCWTLLIGWRF